MTDLARFEKRVPLDHGLCGRNPPCRPHAAHDRRERRHPSYPVTGDYAGRVRSRGMLRASPPISPPTPPSPLSSKPAGSGPRTNARAQAQDTERRCRMTVARRSTWRTERRRCSLLVILPSAQRLIRTSNAVPSTASVPNPAQEVIPVRPDQGDRFDREQPAWSGAPMDQPVNPDERDPSVIRVVAVSLVAGLACTLAPAATARLAGSDATPAAGPRGRPGGPGSGSGPVRRVAVLAMAASPGDLEPGHCRRVAGISPVSTRPSGRCRPCRRHRL